MVVMFTILLRTFAFMMNKKQLERYLYSSPLGELLLCGREETLCGIWFVGERYYPTEKEELPIASATSGFVDKSIKWLDAYFSHQPLPETPCLDAEGTTFQQTVWKVLQTLPYGMQVSYSDVAHRVSEITGGKLAIRAVASAIGRNPINLIVPCHRVVGKDGALHGFAGGLERKQWLLHWEQQGRG